jgi:oxalate decarboxylase/phosphoglucose isomerase-like protein (cupin superfamily)
MSLTGGAAGGSLLWGIANAGDVVFVPANAWHCVLNLQRTIAGTNDLRKMFLYACLLLVLCASCIYALPSK